MSSEEVGVRLRGEGKGLPPRAQSGESSQMTHWKQIWTYHLKLDYFLRGDLRQRLRMKKKKHSNLLAKTEGFNVFHAHRWYNRSSPLCWSSFCHLKLWWDTCCLLVQTTPSGLSWVPAWSSRHLEENTSHEEMLTSFTVGPDTTYISLTWWRRYQMFCTFGTAVWAQWGTAGTRTSDQFQANGCSWSLHYYWHL